MMRKLNTLCVPQGTLGVGKAISRALHGAGKAISRASRWLLAEYSWLLAEYKSANMKCVNLTIYGHMNPTKTQKEGEQWAQSLIVLAAMLLVLVPGLEISLQYLDALGEINYPTGAARHE